MLQHLSVEDCDLIKDLICGQNEDYELLEGEGSSEEYGSSDDDESFESLREKLDDESEDVRAHCACSLGLVGGNNVVQYLEQKLQDESQKVRKHAKAAISKILNTDDQ